MVAFSIPVANWADPSFHYGRTASAQARPFSGLVVHHTADKPIENLVRYGQRDDPQRGGAFGYHFYIGRDGRVIQGAPLDKRTNHIKPPSHAARRRDFGTNLSNSNALGISLVGAEGGATPEQMRAAQALAQDLMREYGITPDNIFGHGQLQSDRQHQEGLELVNMLRDGTRLAQADTGTTTDAYSREELMEEARRRGLIAEEGTGYSREELMAEARRRGLIEDKGSSGGMARAPRAMIADLNAGFQGVNPVSVSKATPLGVVVREGDNAYLDVDGTKTLIKPEDYGNYVTQVDPETGLELLYKRTPEMEESGLASAGRVLGYGIMGSPGGAGVKATARPPAKGAQAEAMQAAKELDITPSLGMTGPAGARTAGAMESLYPTAGRVVDDAARATDELAAATARTAGKVGSGSTPFEGGQALLEGAGDFLVKNLKGTDAVPSKSARLFSRVDRHIPKGTRIDVSGLTDTLKGFVQRFADAPEIAQSLGQGKWLRWLDDIERNSGQLTWEQTRALRSDIGEAIGKMTGPMTDAAGGELKQLYGALTRDLEAAANAAGPGAASAWKNAVSHYKWASEKVGEALDIMFKAKSPEQAYSNFLALASASGSRANLAKLRDIKRALPEEDWANVIGTVIRRMGQATAGAQDAAGEVFSASRFLTDWNKLSPTAKSILFDGKGVPKGLRAELDALAKVMETAKNAAKQTNVSRSGTVMGNLSMGGMLLWEPVYAFGTAVLSHLTARALTNPKVLRGIRNYIARGGTKEAARQLLEAAGENRALLGDVATIIRLEAPRSSGPALPARPTAEPLALPR